MTRRRILILKLLVLLIVVSLVVLKSRQKDGAHSSPEGARRELIENNIELSADAFVKSVRDGNVEAVKLFLDAGMSPESKDESGSTVLMNAAIKNDYAVAQLLVSRSHNHTEVVDLLTAAGAEE